MRILLIAEDNPENARLATGVEMAPFGPHSVMHVGSLGEALIHLDDLRTDVVVLDLDTASSTPIRLIQEVRLQRSCLPILVLIDYPNPDLSLEALRQGAQDVLAKERLTPEALSRAARYALERTILTRELGERDRQYRRIVETAEEGIWTIDAQDRTVFANPKMTQLLGYSLDEMIGQSPLAFLDAEAQAIAVPKLAAVRRGEIARLEIRLRRKDGSALWTAVTANPTFNEDGRYEGALAVVTDIGDRREKEEALCRLAALVESSADAIISIDLEGTVMSWNRSAETLYGYSEKEALGRSIRFVVPPEGQVELDGILCRNRKGESTPAFETVRKHRDGHLIPVSIQISPMRNSQGKLIAAVAIVRDISAQHKLQGQFRQAQKMEAVGRLAGGVAHDFNNLLTVINGYSEMVLGRLTEEDPSRSDVEEILRAGQRAGALTRQLLAFSRKQVLSPQVTSLNPMIRTLEKMLQRLIGEDIQLSTVLQEDLGNVKVDLGQMEQVIMNLAVNARDAMPRGGRLQIETRNTVVEEGQVGTSSALPPGAYVRLSVTDTGVGMDKDIQSHLFEPFFTTKGIGKGTGLGLSTIYGIVRQSGGAITVYSEPGNGTCFKVYLPRTTASAEADSIAKCGISTLRGTETILVVEDSETIRRMTCQILEKQGYHVRSASTAEAGIESFSREGFPDLLLTDMILPGMSGSALCRNAAQQKWGIKRLLMTGYTEESVANQGMLNVGLPLLQKPFSPTELLTAVRRALGEPSPSRAASTLVSSA